MIRIALFTLLSFCLTESLYAGGESPGQDRPSAAMLEFLAQFEDVDDETFELLVEHGLRDHKKQDNQQQQEEPHGEDE